MKIKLILVGGIYMKATILDYVRITDESHNYFGRTGRLTDYDMMDCEYVLHFDKLTKNGHVRQASESTRVNRYQVEKISKLDLEKE
jgi:hypothetical protein